VSAAEAAYQLLWDTDAAGDDPLARLVRFPGWREIVRWSDTAPRPAPDPVRFEATAARAAGVDFPSNDVRWPLMSRAMIEALRGVGDLPCRLLPVELIDPRAPGARVELSAVQLTQHARVIDVHASEVEWDEDYPGMAFFISRLALRPPPGGLPPLFRLAERPAPLWVSPAGRDALLAAGVRGFALAPASSFAG